VEEEAIGNKMAGLENAERPSFAWHAAFVDRRASTSMLYNERVCELGHYAPVPTPVCVSCLRNASYMIWPRTQQENDTV